MPRVLDTASSVWASRDTLRKYCKQLKLPVVGCKEDLVKRLQQAGMEVGHSAFSKNQARQLGASRKTKLAARLPRKRRKAKSKPVLAVPTRRLRKKTSWPTAQDESNCSSASSVAYPMPLRRFKPVSRPPERYSPAVTDMEDDYTCTEFSSNMNTSEEESMEACLDREIEQSGTLSGFLHDFTAS